MSWGRLDDKLPDHPKIVALSGPPPRWQFVCGILYCARHSTNGFIADEAISGLVPGQTFVKTLRFSRELVKVGLWEQRPNGYVVHDYLDYNLTAEEVSRRRTAATNRQRHRRGSTGETRPEPVTRLSHDPDPSPPLSTSVESSTTGPGRAGGVLHPATDAAWAAALREDAERAAGVRKLIQDAKDQLAMATRKPPARVSRPDGKEIPDALHS